MLLFPASSAVLVLFLAVPSASKAPTPAPTAVCDDVGPYCPPLPNPIPGCRPSGIGEGTCMCVQRVPGGVCCVEANSIALSDESCTQDSDCGSSNCCVRTAGNDSTCPPDFNFCARLCLDLNNDEGTSYQDDRRLTQGTIALEPGDDNYVKYAAMCAEHDYKGWLVIEESHFYVVGSPSQGAVAAGCPHVATHATFEGPKVQASGAPYEKEILVWPNKDKRLEYFLKDALFIGTFKLSDVIRAHESIDPSKTSSTHTVYDIVDLNCVDFPMALGAALNVRIDAKMVSFVTSRLLEQSGEAFIDMIRNSASFQSIFQGDRTLLRSGDSGHESLLTDEQVIETLVEKRTSDLM